MKKFKRLLAVVMVMMLLFTALPMTSASAKVTFPKLVLNTPSTVTIGEDGITFTFKPAKDGSYKFYSLGDADTAAMLYDDDDLFEYNDNVDKNNKNFAVATKLKAGTTYYLEVWANSTKDVTAQIVVEEVVGVDSIKITQYPFDTTVVFDYEYDTYSADGLKATFTFTDGSSYDWEYDEYNVINGKNYVNGYMVGVYLDYDYQDNFYLFIECGGVKESIPYTTVESPVESIEYICDTPIECYENTNGFWMEDNTYYYYYDVPKGAMMKINYKDGTSKTASIDDEVDGLYFNEYDYQETSKAWKVGGDNYFYIEYLDAYVKVPVTILPCPFKSVTVNSVPTKDYIFGDFDFGDFLNMDDKNEYTLYPTDIRGLSFTVEYDDGTTETFDDDDFDITKMTIDGYEYEVTDFDTTKTGTFETTLYYKGAQIKYDVDVVESYIDSIEILKGPDRSEYEDIYYADFTGTEIKINYKDGTSAQAVANEETLSYVMDEWWFSPQIKVGNDVVTIYGDFDVDTMESYDCFTCAGVTVNYYGNNYTYNKEVEAITAENVNMTGDNIVINVEYTDGTSEELVTKVLDSYVRQDGAADFAGMTKNGIVVYEVEKSYDQNGKFEGYDLWALDCTYVEKVEIGDVDRDKVVSIMDATEIQMVVAKKKPALDDIVIADIDGDKEVSVMDATAIQRQIAKI